jgi:hypothetical protein
MIDLATFISQYLGKANTGDTGPNKGQCVGLIEVWLDANGKPHIPGNAVDLLANADPKVYKRTNNIPTNAPPPGAVVCWAALVVFEQNDPTGSPPMVATHNYNGVAGWLTF